MNVLGNDIVVSKGETFTFDVNITTQEGHPLEVSSEFSHPYIVLTLAARELPDAESYRHSYWLDLSHINYQGATGAVTTRSIKKFQSTVPFQVSNFSIATVLAEYPDLVDDADLTKKNNIRNFLFYRDANLDGNYEYKYLTSSYGAQTEVWESYFFRFAKEIDTSNLSIGTYYYTFSLISGLSVYAAIDTELGSAEGTTTKDNVVARWALLPEGDVKAELKPFVEEGLPIKYPFANNIELSKNTLKITSNLKGKWV